MPDQKIDLLYVLIENILIAKLVNWQSSVNEKVKIVEYALPYDCREPLVRMAPL